MLSPNWLASQDRELCRYLFFISHVREDAEDVRLLRTCVNRKLRAKRAKGQPPQPCFLDLYDWQNANPIARVIRDKLLESLYMVAWVTPAYLRQARRGWVWFELAYADEIERGRNFAFGEIRHPFIVPAFRGVGVQAIAQTPWLDYWQRRLDSGPKVQAVAETLVAFHEQESSKWQN